MNGMNIYPFERTSPLLDYYAFDIDILQKKIFTLFKHLEHTGHVKVLSISHNLKPKQTRYCYLYPTDTFSIRVKCTIDEIDKTFLLHIPRMINRKFTINGYENIPIFQMVDPAVVARPGHIFVRSAFNDLSVVYNEKHCQVYAFRKKMTLSTILFAVRGFRKACKYFGVKVSKVKSFTKGDSRANKMILKDQCIEILNMDALDPIGQLVFRTACYEKYKDVLETFGTDEFFIGMLGNHFFDKRNFMKKGEEILESFKTAFFDPITKEQLNYNGDFFKFMVDLLTQYLNTQAYDFLDLERRVIRLEDYILVPLFQKIFSIVRVSMKYPQRVHHIKIKPDEMTGSLSKPELQPLIQYDSSLNPIGEVSTFFKCSIFGISGLQKSQVSIAMRNIHPSYYGSICPIDTPDGPSCGVVMNLVPTAQLNIEDGKLEIDRDHETRDIVSLPVATIPFLERNDGVRLQMGANQSEQSKILDVTELPTIQTGAEHLVAKMSTFVRRSPVDGIISFINKNFIVVKDEAGKHHLVDARDEFTRRKMFKSFDHQVTIGQKVRKGMILSADSRCIKDDKVTLGRNLKTCFFCYEGNTYEDAIVVSEEAAEKMSHWEYNVTELTIGRNETLREYNGKFFPAVGEVTKDGVLTEKQTIDPEIRFLFDYDRETEKIAVPPGSEVVDIRVYVNNEHELQPELKEYIDALVCQQMTDERSQFNTIKRFVEDPDLLAYHKNNTLKSHRIGRFYGVDHFEGVLFRIFTKRRCTLMKGDKLANRAGNKGVVSAILPVDQMPRGEDGVPFEICLNPMGIITRMNTGQLFEMTLGTACKEITKRMQTLPEDRALDFMLEMIELVDNTEEHWYSIQAKDHVSSLEPHAKTALYNKVCTDGLQLYQPPFASITLDNYMKLVEILGISEKEHLFIPELNTTTSDPVGCGYTYVLKLLHTSESKIHSRSIGPYSQITGQPLQGKRNQGAQRLGEMEIWALAAHDADATVKEILTIKSDDIAGRKAMIRNFLDATPISMSSSEESLSKTIFMAYMKGLMIKLE